jgi:hypothetical protein
MKNKHKAIAIVLFIINTATYLPLVTDSTKPPLPPALISGLNSSSVGGGSGGARNENNAGKQNSSAHGNNPVMEFSWHCSCHLISGEIVVKEGNSSDSFTDRTERC